MVYFILLATNTGICDQSFPNNSYVFIEFYVDGNKSFVYYSFIQYNSLALCVFTKLLIILYS